MIGKRPMRHVWNKKQRMPKLPRTNSTHQDEVLRWCQLRSISQSQNGMRSRGGLSSWRLWYLPGSKLVTQAGHAQSAGGVIAKTADSLQSVLRGRGRQIGPAKNVLSAIAGSKVVGWLFLSLLLASRPLLSMCGVMNDRRTGGQMCLLDLSPEQALCGGGRAKPALLSLRADRRPPQSVPRVG
jgi:hypothetical protein